MDKSSSYLAQGVEKILLNAKECTDEGIFSNYKGVTEPNVEVTPELLQIRFYDGDWVLGVKQYTPGTILSRRADERRHEKKVGAYDVFKDEDGPARCVLFTGAPGSGKTTILNRLARDALGHRIPILSGIKVVHVLNCRDFEPDTEIHPSDFLFRNVSQPLSADETMVTYEWMRNNQRDVIFFVDSLDTLPYSLEEVRKPTVSYQQKSLPAEILYNLLSGGLFPHSRVVTSSREHTIRNFEGPLRPDKVIGLAGLSEESIRKLIFGLLDKEKAEGVWDYITSVSPNLLNLCTVPVFLVFTLLGLLQASSFKPSTMSGIMVKLLHSLVHSGHAHEEEIVEILNKLKSLAFAGTKEGRVLFNTKELQTYGLTLKNIFDLIISVPGMGGTTYGQKMLEGRNVLFFCHQSIQEALSAMYISQMNVGEFEAFISEHLHRPHWRVVRRILCGLLLDPICYKEASVYLLQGVDDIEAKRNVLKEHLKTALATMKKNKTDLLEIFISLHESGDETNDVIKTAINEVNLWNVFLTRSDIYAVARVIYHCSHLEELKLLGCNLNPTTVPVFAKALEGSSVTITRLDASFCNMIGNEGIHALGRVVRQCRVEELDIKDSNLTSQHLECLESALNDARLGKLVISGNQNIGQQGAAAVAKIAAKCKLKELNMEACSLSKYQLEKFYKNIDGGEMTTLVMNRNRGLDQEGIEYLGKVVRKEKIENLEVSACEFNTEELRCLLHSLQGTKLKCMDISEPTFMSRSMCPEDTEIILQIAFHVRERLILRGWCFDAAAQTRLKNWLLQHDLHTVVEFGSSGERHLESRSIIQITPPIVAGEGNDSHAQHRGAFYEDQASGGSSSRERPKGHLNATEAWIGPKGGIMELNDCRITFPEDSVSKSTLMGMEMFVDKFDTLENFLPISPILHCSPSGLYLHNAAQIRFHTKFRTVDNDDIIVHILLKEEEGHAWEIIESLPLAIAGGIIEFQCSRFTWFALVVDYVRSWFRKMTFVLACSLHYDALGNFTLALCIDDETNRKKCLHDLQLRKFTLTPANLNKITAKVGDLLRISLEFDDAGPSIFEPPETSIQASEDLLKTWKIYSANFELLPLPLHNFRVRWKITQNGDEHTQSSCKVKWPVVIEGERPNDIPLSRDDNQARQRSPQVNPHITTGNQNADLLINWVENLHVDARSTQLPASLALTHNAEAAPERIDDRERDFPEEID